jgi:hypothetical protein
MLTPAQLAALVAPIGLSMAKATRLAPAYVATITVPPVAVYTDPERGSASRVAAPAPVQNELSTVGHGSPRRWTTGYQSWQPETIFDKDGDPS